MYLDCGKVKKIMIEKEITYEQIADFCGIKVDSLRFNLRKDYHKVRTSTASKLYKALGCKVEDIVISKTEYREILLSRMVTLILDREKLVRSGLADTEQTKILEKEIDSITGKLVDVK